MQQILLDLEKYTGRYRGGYIAKKIQGRIHSQENTGVDIESGRYRGGYIAKIIQGPIHSQENTGADT